ncbi:putative bifunctional inhibitor/plant lipid transfer protein/seed storage helical [Medicago truncatula]|uniref:ECA1 gametogenesis related family n=1 Tax=Medicago truncatula TaxID=3880 RepID=G7LEE8_MEDTR|nr:ECA1 gametogenesis related family [Medicago truncatula]RHN38963.1 putative bifunctional inhibitor/plant lipid transfer protein/seed storage helical [Medicago truncatula]
MATFHTLSILYVAIICFSMLVKSEISSPISPSSNESLSPYQKYLTTCIEKLTQPCDDEIFYTVYIGNQTVSYECCSQLVNDMGQRCHDEITRFIVESPKFKANKISILQRSKKVWNECSNAFDVDSPLGSIVPDI